MGGDPHENKLRLRHITRTTITNREKRRGYTHRVEIILMFSSMPFRFDSIVTTTIDELLCIIYGLPVHLTESPNLNEIIKIQFKRNHIECKFHEIFP